MEVISFDSYLCLFGNMCTAVQVHLSDFLSVSVDIYIPSLIGIVGICCLDSTIYQTGVKHSLSLLQSPEGQERSIPNLTTVVYMALLILVLVLF